jgi:phage terminase large subunit-like protein
VRQNLSTLTGACKEFERLLMGKRLRHTGSPVMRWCVGNVIVDMDAAGNLRPNKEKSGAKIDGVSAVITGLERAMVHAGPSVYDTRPPIFVDL